MSIQINFTQVIKKQSLLPTQTFTHQLDQPVPKTGMMPTHCVTDSGSEGVEVPLLSERIYASTALKMSA